MLLPIPAPHLTVLRYEQPPRICSWCLQSPPQITHYRTDTTVLSECPTQGSPRWTCKLRSAEVRSSSGSHSGSSASPSSSLTRNSSSVVTKSPIRPGSPGSLVPPAIYRRKADTENRDGIDPQAEATRAPGVNTDRSCQAPHTLKAARRGMLLCNQ